MPPRKKFTRDKLLPPYKRAPLDYGTIALIVLGRALEVSLYQNLGTAIKATSNFKREPTWIISGPAHKITALVKELGKRKESLDTAHKIESYVAKLIESEDEMSVADRANMPFDLFFSEAADDADDQPFVEDAEWRDRVTAALDTPCRYSLDKFAVQEAEHLCKKIPGNEPVLKWVAVEKIYPTVADAQFDVSRVHLFESLIKGGKNLGPIVVDNEGKIFDGKHRWMGAKRAQVKKVPVLRNSVGITSLYDTGFASSDVEHNPIWAAIDATTKLACSACDPIADHESGYLHFTLGSSDSDDEYVRKVAIQANSDSTYRVHLVQIAKADFSSKVLKKAAKVPADELSTFIGFMIR